LNGRRVAVGAADATSCAASRDRSSLQGGRCRRDTARPGSMRCSALPGRYAGILRPSGTPSCSSGATGRPKA